MGNLHRGYTLKFKVRVVPELLSSKHTLVEASREYKIKDSVISHWRQEFLERTPQIFESCPSHPIGYISNQKYLFSERTI